MLILPWEFLWNFNISTGSCIVLNPHYFFQVAWNSRFLSFHNPWVLESFSRRQSVTLMVYLTRNSYLYLTCVFRNFWSNSKGYQSLITVGGERLSLTPEHFCRWAESHKLPRVWVHRQKKYHKFVPTLSLQNIQEFTAKNWSQSELHGDGIALSRSNTCRFRK